MHQKDVDGDNICALCEHGKLLFDEDTVLCRHKGLVRATASCRRFRSDPLKRDIRPLPVMPGLELLLPDDRDDAI